MKDIKHRILGTVYSVLVGSRSELMLKDGLSGECRLYGKKLKICSDREDCTERELRVKVQEIVAHEVLHAYINEAGIELEPEVEELLANFFMKNWRKMNNSILDILDQSGFLDK